MPRALSVWGECKGGCKTGLALLQWKSQGGRSIFSSWPPTVGAWVVGKGWPWGWGHGSEDPGWAEFRRTFADPVCVWAQRSLTLCDPTDCSLPGSSVHGILSARILGWVPFSPPGDLPDPGIEPVSSASPALDSLPLNHLGSPWFLPKHSSPNSSGN